MLLDCHGVGGQGQGDGVEGGNQDWGEDDNRKLGFVWFLLSSTELEFPGSVQGGNKSRQIFPFTPKTPDSIRFDWLHGYGTPFHQDSLPT